LSTGHFIIDDSGRVRIAIQQPLHTISGYVFEAYAVREFNEKKGSVGKNAYLWATEMKRISSYKRLEKTHAIGTGFPETRAKHPELYNPTNRRFDIVFYRVNESRNMPEPVPVKGTTSPAGIQVKAIKGNEKSQIIDPILDSTYWRVVTFLEHDSGMHSYEACVNTAREMRRKGEISHDELIKVEDAVCSPAQLGLDQYNVNGYYKYIKAWYNERAKADDLILGGIGTKIKEPTRDESLITSLN